MATEAKINDGGPAFPSEWDTQLGMNLRDWFAGQCASNSVLHLASYISEAAEGYDVETEAFLLASAAYAMADAMLKARKGEA